MNKKIGFGLLMLSFVSFVVADMDGVGNYSWMGNMGGYGVGMMGFGWLLMLLIIIVLVLLIIWLSKQIWNNDGKRKR